MKNNILALYDYQDKAPENSEFRVHRRAFGAQICFWISHIIDMTATIAITGCTVFCCYLALTML